MNARECLPKLSVIGAGLGRTGTLSLKFALERLGFGPCHHMVELLSCDNRRERQAEWSRVAAGGTPDWPLLLNGYRSTVDWPTCNYVLELFELKPGAKVILSVRRDAEKWYDSASQTIFGGEDQPSFVLAMAQYVLGDDLRNRRAVIEAYERHNAAIVAAVPPAQLLVFDPSQGWGPLCDFLDRSAPREPFPHLNTRLQFQLMTRARSGLPERWSASLARLTMTATTLTHRLRR